MNHNFQKIKQNRTIQRRINHLFGKELQNDIICLKNVGILWYCFRIASAAPRAAIVY